MRTVEGDALIHALLGKEDFRYRRSHLTGRAGNFAFPTFGELPASWHASLCRADFAAYSYETPIAWHVEGEGWTMPPIRYSVTTTQHQYTVARALNIDWRSWGPGSTAANKGRGRSPYGPRTGGF